MEGEGGDGSGNGGGSLLGGNGDGGGAAAAFTPSFENAVGKDGAFSEGWTAKAFGAMPVSWIAEIINDVPFETIGWKTLPGETMQHAGSVVFKLLPETGATDVRVHFQYAPPGGKAAAWFAAFLGQDPAKLTRDGLQALKARLESGTVSATRSTSTI